MKTEDIFSKFDEQTAMTASKLRNFIMKEIKGLMEIPDQSVNMIGYGFGTGYKDLICTILLSKQGVKLGFNRGCELPDPTKILTGSGKVHRYVIISNDSDIKDPAIKQLLKHALVAYQKRSV